MHSASTENDKFSHTTPIYATSTFTFDSTDEGMERFKSADKTRIYSRWGNPTFTAAQDVIAALEAFGLKNEKGEQPMYRAKKGKNKEKKRLSKQTRNNKNVFNA